MISMGLTSPAKITNLGEKKEYDAAQTLEYGCKNTKKIIFPCPPSF
jgi:hypothetical protein